MLITARNGEAQQPKLQRFSVQIFYTLHGNLIQLKGVKSSSDDPKSVVDLDSRAAFQALSAMAAASLREGAKSRA